MTLRLTLCLLAALGLCACSGREGYQILHQMGYQECIKQSLHPIEECGAPPSYESYKQELEQKNR